MIKAIFYKEWIKMRCFYPLSALFLFGATAYALLRVQRVITFKGAAHVWEVMLEKEVVFIDILQYLPALLGVLLAVVQFVPEMAQKRLKLTLHLPFPQWKMILLMSGIGLGALALLFIVQTAVLWGYLHARADALPAAGRALSRTHMETAAGESADRRGRLPDLLPLRHPAGLRRHAAVAGAAAGMFAVLPAAFGIPFQAGMSGLTRKTTNL